MATLAADVPVFREFTPGQRVLRRLVRRRGAMAGLAVVVFFVSVALLAPLVAPYDPLQTSWSAVRKAPSAMHIFGTDEIGRDVAARVIYGARASLLAGLVSVCISLSLGIPIGLLAGYVGGWIDALISRITDAMLACPFLILAIALAAFLGPSLTNAMIAIGISATPIFIRLTRAQVLAVKVEDYVEARIAACAPQRGRAADRPGDIGDCRGGHRRGEPVVPRTGATAAGAIVGQHAQHGQELYRQRAMDGGLARPVDISARALVQSFGRRIARRSRSATQVAP